MTDELHDALRQMETAYVAAEADAANLEAQASKARGRADALRVATESLRRFLGDDALAPTTGSTPVPTDQGPLHFVDAEIPQRKRIRSSAFLHQILMDRGGPMTKDEIIEAFFAAGLTQGMRNPPNAIGTAISRNVAAGRVVQVGPDLYVAPGPREFERG